MNKKMIAIAITFGLGMSLQTAMAADNSDDLVIQSFAKASQIHAPETFKHQPATAEYHDTLTDLVNQTFWRSHSQESMNRNTYN